MSQYRPAVACAAAALIVFLPTGCSHSAPRQANPLDSPAAAGKLCDALRPQLPAWRTQTATPNRIAFSITVQQWAAAAVRDATPLSDRSLPDSLTGSACPDVRRDTIAALGTPNLAAALVGP